MRKSECEAFIELKFTLNFVPEVNVAAVKLVELDSAIPAPPTDKPAPPIKFVDTKVPTPAEY